MNIKFNQIGKEKVFCFFIIFHEYQPTNKQRQTITQSAQYRTPRKENNLHRQLQVYIYTGKKRKGEKINICNCPKEKEVFFCYPSALGAVYHPLFSCTLDI